MRLAAFVGFAAVALVGCSNNPYGSGGSCNPGASQVCMISSTFSPVNKSVPVGTTVQWINGDGSTTHTVTSDPSSSESFNQSVVGGGMFTHQFNTAGTYNYHCTIHGSVGMGMHGTITVTP